MLSKIHATLGFEDVQPRKRSSNWWPGGGCRFAGSEERKQRRKEYKIKEERTIRKFEDLKNVLHALTRSVGELTVAILNQAAVNHSHNINVEGLLFSRP